MSRFRWATLPLSAATLLSCLLVPQLGRGDAPDVPAKPAAARDPVPWTVKTTDGVADTPELGRPVTWNLEEKTLIEAFLAIEEQAGIPVIVHRSLAERPSKAEPPLVSEKSIGRGFRRPDAAQDPEENPLRMTSRVVDLPLWAALNIFVREMPGRHLGWRYKEGCLELASYDEANDRRSIHQYDLKPLRMARVPISEIVDLIEENLIGPWDRHEPGTGTCRVTGDSLIVRGNDANHRSVRALLSAVTMEDGDEIVIDAPPPSLKLEQALNEPFTPRFVDVPLLEALKAISEGLPTPIQMTAEAERLCPADSPRRIHLELPARPRRVVLRLLLEQISDNLTLSVRGNRPVVTTRDHDTEQRSLRLYDLRDADSHGRVPEFVQTIFDSTSGPWDIDEMGTGVLSLAAPGRLLVGQNEPTHRELRELLQRHRPAWQRDNGSPKRMENRVYWVRSDLAEPMATLIRETVSPGLWNDSRQGRIVRIPVPGVAQQASGAAAAQVRPSDAPPPWKPLRSWQPMEPLSLGEFDSYPTAMNGTTAFFGTREYGDEARVDLRGDPSKPSQVMIIRAPFDVHRQIDRRVQQFLTVNSAFQIVGLPPQLGFLVHDIELPASNAVTAGGSAPDENSAEATRVKSETAAEQ